MAYVAKNYSSSSKNSKTQQMLDAIDAKNARKVDMAHKMQNRTTVVTGSDEKGGGG